MLWGRASESDRLDAVFADAAAGRGGVLVVRGEPGVGKSALLSDASSRASGARVLWTQGIESESPLAFAALHRLLRPVLPYLDRLPAPQARALRGAFGEQFNPTIAFAPCPDDSDFECGTLAVPADYDHPGRPRAGASRR